MRKKLLAALAGATLAGGLAAAPPSAAAATPSNGNDVSIRGGYVGFTSPAGHPCGRSVSGWNRYYRHCGTTPVEVLASFALVGNTIACVGNNEAVTVSTATTWSLDWNGNTCNRPGTTRPE